MGKTRQRSRGKSADEIAYEKRHGPVESERKRRLTNPSGVRSAAYRAGIEKMKIKGIPDRIENICRIYLYQLVTLASNAAHNEGYKRVRPNHVFTAFTAIQRAPISRRLF